MGQQCRSCADQRVYVPYFSTKFGILEDSCRDRCCIGAQATSEAVARQAATVYREGASIVWQVEE